ncbi:hypothetical protein [Sphingobium bisphenolivorans]|uniref:hypothetical protein n=1 Tax=Sphingobium bisphenolivorans TaxID=1335760 RepID=UPI0003B53003|nr:hypothetical protein [Sphingobium bisphenolivorans]
MHALIILEITRQRDGALPGRLLHLAYRASQRGRVLLLLNGVSSFEVDAVLDPLVQEMPLDIPGLLYCDINDPVCIPEALRQASMIFISPQLARRCQAMESCARSLRGSPGAALPVLERMSRPTSLRELAVRVRRPRGASTPLRPKEVC